MEAPFNGLERERNTSGKGSLSAASLINCVSSGMPAVYYYLAQEARRRRKEGSGLSELY